MRSSTFAFLAALTVFPLIWPVRTVNAVSLGYELFAAPSGPATEVLFHRKRGKVELTIQDSGRTLSLPIKQTIQITLSENPTTGYRWQVLESGTPVLRLRNDSFQRGSSSAVGAGGNRIFEFVTDAAGAAALRLGYARSGDTSSQKNEFVLTVQVSSP